MEKSAEVATVRNFRDLGGARTSDGRRFAPGLVFRSGLFSEMSPEDRETLQRQLGIRTIIDIRRAHEHGSAVSAPLEGARLLQMPLTPKDVRVLIDRSPRVDAVVTWYRRQLDVSRPALKELIEAIEAFGSEPLVFHCHAGKDRTGVVSAVLLGGLGVIDEDIVADYSRSCPADDDAWFATLPEVFREARPEVMERLLDIVREDFGSMRQYLLDIGVTEASLKTLESRYLMNRQTS